MSNHPTAPLEDVIEETKSGFACGDDPSEGIFQIRMNNITLDGHLDFSRKRRVPFGTKNLAAFLLKPGDVLFNATNSPELVGKSAYFAGHNEPTVFSNHFLRLRPSEKRLDGRYLARYLQLKFQQRVFQNICRQWVNQATVGRDTLLSLSIPLPPLPEQRRIAAILDKADALRAKRRAALAQLDALTQSIFLGMFGDPATNPKGWKPQSIGNMLAEPLNFGTMIPPVAEARRWLSLRVANIQNWKLELSDRKYVELPDDMVKRHTVQDGDLLMARAIASQEHLGKCIVAHPRTEKWAFDSHLMRIRLNTKRLNPDFLRHVLITEGGRSLFLRAARKTSVQYNINTKEMASLRVPVPPIELQEVFANKVATIERLKTGHNSMSLGLDSLFASLQHRAFRGEL